MLNFLIYNLLQSYRAPRAAARRALEVIDTFEEIALILGLSFTVTAFLEGLVLFAGGGVMFGIGLIFSNLVFNLVAYVVAMFLIQRIGALFGGGASMRDIAVVLAWHSLMMVVFAPLVAVVMLPGVGPGVLMLIGLALLALVGFMLWLLANFIAEAHGFASALRVAGALFAGMFVIGLVLSSLIPNLLIPAQ
ncbi:MAG: hypothetical protein ACK5MQ_18155 [Pikeienuella sp.]